MTLKFNIAYNEGDPTSLSVLHDGNMLVASADHPNWDRLLKYVPDATIPEQDIVKLFDVGQALAGNFAKISDRIAIRGQSLYFDMEKVDDVLADTILKFYYQGNDEFRPLVNFMEKVKLNPSANSQTQLFAWIKRNDFGIHEDGDIIAYKGVKRDRKGGFISSSSGHAMVNGVEVRGRIPTSPDTIVEMPRSEVADNPGVACHTGLHAGDWSYASTFAAVTLEVKINPRDVVSVPSDSQERKMRVCRYRVMGEVTEPNKNLLRVTPALATLFTGMKERGKTTKLPAPTGAIVVSDDSPVEEAPLDRLAAAVKPKRHPMLKVDPAKAKAAAKKSTTTKKPVVKSAVKEYRYSSDKKQDKSKSIAKVSKTTATKKVVAKPIAPLLPKFYEDFAKADFATRPFNELRWLAKEWGVKAGSNPKRDALVTALTKAASARRRRKAPTATVIK
jgi:hypothetical protein